MQKKINLNKVLNKNNISNLLLKKNFFLKSLNKSKIKKNIRVEILGGYTINDLSDWIKIFCINNNIKVNIAENKWSGGFLSIGEKKFYENKNNFNIIINSWRDLFPRNNFNHFILEPNEIIKVFISFVKKNKSKTIITTFDCPEFEILVGKKNLNQVLSYLNHEIYRIFGNDNIYSIINEQHNVISKNIPWNSQRDWYSFGKAFTNEASLYLAHQISTKINYSIIPQKKLLILDLDNTLWGGVIGDDGTKNIKIGDESSEGRIFSEIQSYFKMIKNRGVLLAIASKNEEKIALEGLKQKKSILKISDFVTTRINWRDKSENILSIAKEINLSLDSFVFVDDNPSERDLVRKKLPEVSVPEIGQDPEEFIKKIDDYKYFNFTSKISDEDLNRTKFYQLEKIRKKLERESSSKNFLKSLNITVEFIKDFKNNLDRVYQLTNKTNQFNLTTERLEINQIKNFHNKPNKKIIIVNAKDKYGDYGIISIVYLTISKNSFNINNWLMSCRVFNKTIENAIMYKLIQSMKRFNKKTLNLTFIRTKKNLLMIDLLKDLGFVEIKKVSNIKSQWKLIEKNIKHECTIKNEI